MLLQERDLKIAKLGAEVERALALLRERPQTDILVYGASCCGKTREVRAWDEKVDALLPKAEGEADILPSDPITYLAEGE